MAADTTCITYFKDRMSQDGLQIRANNIVSERLGFDADNPSITTRTVCEIAIQIFSAENLMNGQEPNSGYLARVTFKPGEVLSEQDSFMSTYPRELAYSRRYQPSEETVLGSRLVFSLKETLIEASSLGVTFADSHQVHQYFQDVYKPL